jgi:virginiamycin B lyase
MKGIRSLSCLAATVAALLVAVSPAAAAETFAPASARGVTEFQVEANRISSLSQAGDGTILYKGSVGTNEHLQSRLGRVGQTGPLGEVPTSQAQNLVTSGDGTTWAIVEDSTNQSWVGRQTTFGSWEQIAGTIGAKAIGGAAKGGVWFLQNEPHGNYGPDAVGKVGFVSATGQVTSFAAPGEGAALGSIVEGREGDAWFPEHFGGKIWRITPSGELTEFKLASDSRPTIITVDGSGNLWFTEPEQSRIGRITPAGQITEFPLPKGVTPSSIAAGGDGRIWFSEWSSPEPTAVSGGLGHIGRITPTGRFTQIQLPNRESFPESLIAGSEGNIWFTAMGEDTFCGGGFSCIEWEPKNPAIVGRIAPTPLKSVVTAATGTVGSRGLRVPLACEGGDAWNHCRGQIAVKIAGKKVASAKYSLEADQVSQVLATFSPGVKSPLRGDKKVGLVSVVASSGGGTRRQVTLTRAGS